MHTLVPGIRHFQQNVFPSKIRLFKRLAKGQQPLALFVTCSDSRINPNLITQTEPGELFILRNAGNIVPPHGTAGGEAATIEFAPVAVGLARSELTLHAWVYTIETGQILAYDFPSSPFNVLAGPPSAPLLRKNRAAAAG